MISRKEIQGNAVAGLDRTFDKSANLKLYFRACERLSREAQTALAEHDDIQAYFVLMRLVELVVNYLPRHPQAKDARYAAGMSKLNKMAASAMADLDRLKVVLDENFEKERKRRIELAGKAANQAAASKRMQADRNQIKESDEESASVKNEQTRSQREADRRDTAEALQRLTVKLPARTTTNPYSVTSYDYPDLPISSTSLVPPRPDKLAPTPAPAEVPASQYSFVSSAKLENGTDLRTVFVPATLRSTFIRLAEHNTSRNLETCGILSGVLKSNAYFVTTLIIPVQESTSDTCHTTDEELLFNYQDQNDLFTLGWIHTHPTQTCFLSSVDLHTHCSYQLMLPEAIAIVLSPSKNPDWGAFRLTDPPGIQTVRKCTNTGLFHPHEESHVYVDVVKSDSHAGHMRELNGMTFHVENQLIAH